MTTTTKTAIRQQLYKERNHFYIRIGEGCVLPLLLILHDHKKFTDIQFMELIMVMQGIIKSHFKNGVGIYSTFIPPEQATNSKPLYLSDLGFTFRFAPTYPKYSIFIKNPIPTLNNNDNMNLKVKRKETTFKNNNNNNNKNEKIKPILLSSDSDNDDDDDKEILNKKKKLKTTTTTTTIGEMNNNFKNNGFIEIIETKFDKEEEKNQDVNFKNDAAIAAALQQEEYNINSNNNSLRNKNKQKEIEKTYIEEEEEEDTESSSQDQYNGGIYKGLNVTGHTLVIETQIKVKSTLPLNTLHNHDDGGDDDDDDFNLPDRESQNSNTSSSTSKSSKKSTVKKTNTKSKSKSKSTISTNNGNNISTYFKN